MTKALLKHLLCLSILLLSVYGNLYAHTYQEGIIHSSKRAFVRNEHASLGTLQNGQTHILKATLSATEQEKFKIVAAEIEEEKHEWISFKKYLENSNYFTTVFYALAFGYICLFFKKRLPSCKYFLYFSSYKWYLLFRAFRIWIPTASRQIEVA